MCGVIGIFSDELDVFPDVVNGLFSMQHRGQDASGIALSDGRRIRLHKAMGYVREVFVERPTPDFRGHLATGHVRYPTQGSNRIESAQPHIVTTLDGIVLALSSNGDLTNYWAVRKDLAAEGVEFVGTNDAELLLKFVAYHHIRGGLTLEDSIRRMQREVRGAYSACLMTRDRLLAFRDPFGVRPLTFGGRNGHWVVASETNALDINKADLVDEVQPGEIVEFGPEGFRRMPHPDVQGARGGRAKPTFCVFEHVYFSRPDSITFGRRVYDVRKRIGRWLSANDDVVGDVVVPVPDSSNAVALGYAQESGLPYELGLVRNHYVGRTFISPEQPRRDEGVKLKFNPLRSVFKDQRVILIDDSIVRGTTSRKLVRMVRAAGAAEVHVRIGSPVTKYSCYYGIDTPNTEELIGHQMNVEEIRDFLTADSLRYMTVDGLKECVGDDGDFCMACFDGDYPIELSEAKARTGAEAVSVGVSVALEPAPGQS